jgi:hypothetical protein
MKRERDIKALSLGAKLYLATRVQLATVPVLLAVILALFLGAVPALASGDSSGAPKVEEFELTHRSSNTGGYVNEGEHPTREFLYGYVVTNGDPTSARFEYSTEGGPWIVFQTESVPIQGSPGVGSGGPTFTVIQHLSPATTYHVREVAENAEGSAESETIKFTTSALGAAPEILQEGCPPRGWEQLGHEGANEGPDAQGENSFLCIRHLTTTSIELESGVQTNGVETGYQFEYTIDPSGSWAPVPGGKGSVTPAEDIGTFEAQLTGLKPETAYYVRVIATSSKGSVTKEAQSFTTGPVRPEAFDVVPSSAGATSAHIDGAVDPNTNETHWHYEYATSEGGPWSEVAGARGTISASQAGEGPQAVEADFTGLSPSKVYYVRLLAENEAEGTRYTSTSGVSNFQTAGAPTASTFVAHALEGETIAVMGSVGFETEPIDDVQGVTLEGAPTGGTFTLSFDGQTTAPIAFNAGIGDVTAALEALPGIGRGNVIVSGNERGPYRTIAFSGAKAGVAEPLLIADGSGLTPSGTGAIAVETVQAAFTYDTHYDIEYVTQEQIVQSGWAGAQSTPEVDAGAGPVSLALEAGEAGRGTSLSFEPEIVSAEIPGLEAGKTYHYRFVASNTTPGDPVTRGGERTLTVPAGSGGEEQETGCPNEALRAGPSKNLPDCRAYEQVTPVDKGGADEPFAYGPLSQGGVSVAQDGETLALYAPYVNWGSATHSGQSPYFFSRTSAGWQMTAAAVQPESGVAQLVPQVFSPDLGQFAFTDHAITSNEARAPDIEYRAGPAGGPYTTVASVPYKEVSQREDDGWVAASEDFSKLILQVEDHTLLGSRTTTASGNDLYEWSDGQLRQVNVGTGSCGAQIVKGAESAESHVGSVPSSAHAVSSDGSRVFFEAAPGGECSTLHLYMRVNGTQTVDIGAYTFRGANAAGTTLLLERHNGSADEFVRYEVEGDGGTATPLFTTHNSVDNLKVSADMSTIYFESGERFGLSPHGGLYRYADGTLSFIAFVGGGREGFVSAEGRYYYFEAEGIAALPGGNFNAGEIELTQVYRYDGVENVLQCISCSSPSEPRAKGAAFFGAGDPSLPTEDGVPNDLVASANGDFVFFVTAAALVPQDLDGEVPPQVNANGEEHESFKNSVSSDVYEWRKDGVDGCGRAQGCLALITSGTGGLLNMRLGTDESGDDVFIYTDSSLVPEDNDTAGDIYDARIDGGEQSPVRPLECEGDACSTPASPPIDSTPASLTFTGPGNLLPAAPVKSSKPAAKKKKRKVKRKARTRRGRKARSGKVVAGRGKAKRSSARSSG